MRRTFSEESLTDEIEHTQPPSLDEEDEREFTFSKEELGKYKRISTLLYNLGLKENFIKTEYGKIRVFRGSELVYLIYSNFEDFISITNYDLEKSKESARKIALSLFHESVILKFKRTEKDIASNKNLRWPRELEYDFSYDKEFNQKGFYHWNVTPYRSPSPMQITGIVILIFSIGFLFLSLEGKLILYELFFWGYAIIIYFFILRFIIVMFSPLTGTKLFIFPNYGNPELGFSQYFHPLYECTKSEDKFLYFSLRFSFAFSLLVLIFLSVYRNLSLFNSIIFKPLFILHEYLRILIIKKNS